MTAAKVQDSRIAATGLGKAETVNWTKGTWTGGKWLTWLACEATSQNYTSRVSRRLPNFNIYSFVVSQRTNSSSTQNHTKRFPPSSLAMPFSSRALRSRYVRFKSAPELSWEQISNLTTGNQQSRIRPKLFRRPLPFESQLSQPVLSSAGVPMPEEHCLVQGKERAPWFTSISHNTILQVEAHSEIHSRPQHTCNNVHDLCLDWLPPLSNESSPIAMDCGRWCEREDPSCHVTSTKFELEHNFS